VKDYYDTRAPEYDEWYLGLGKFEGLERPDWDEDIEELRRAILALPAARTLDVACGTGYLTQHLRGEITILDQSERMLAIAHTRVPAATVRCGDALQLPFPDQSFDRVFTGHFYGHLEDAERAAFLREARRVAPELVVVDAAIRPGRLHDQWQTRELNDGSRFEVFKRYFDPEQLVAELGGGRVAHRGRWFLMVISGPPHP
jgi:demethylmenaquinone methyltransferase/2-methoxy-6-polyprenyl-1,4-benzoquinol methylase